MRGHDRHDEDDELELPVGQPCGGREHVREDDIAELIRPTAMECADEADALGAEQRPCSVGRQHSERKRVDKVDGAAGLVGDPRLFEVLVGCRLGGCCNMRREMGRVWWVVGFAVLVVVEVVMTMEGVDRGQRIVGAGGAAVHAGVDAEWESKASGAPRCGHRGRNAMESDGGGSERGVGLLPTPRPKSTLEESSAWVWGQLLRRVFFWARPSTSPFVGPAAGVQREKGGAARCP